MSLPPAEIGPEFSQVCEMTPPEVEMHCSVCGQNRPLMVNDVPGSGQMVERCLTCVGAGAYPLDLVVSMTARMGGMFFAATWWEEVVEDTTGLFRLTHEEFLALVEDWAADHHRRGVDYG